MSPMSAAIVAVVLFSLIALCTIGVAMNLLSAGKEGRADRPKRKTDEEKNPHSAG